MWREETTMEEDCWDALGIVRQALEEYLPANWIQSADETMTITAEAEALARAIRQVGSVVPREGLKQRPNLSRL
jgi:hypothetical protein